MTRDSCIAKIKRKLRLDRKTKQRVIEGIQTEIQLLLDAGVSIEGAIEKLGSPKEVAGEYNRSYKEDPVYRAKRRSYIFLRISVTTAIVATVLLALSLIGKYVFLHSGHVSTVGGVSGPDSITETVQVISLLFFLDIAERIALILIIAFVLSIICWLLTCIKRKCGIL